RLDDRHHSEYILIQIIDGGMGISPTIQDKIMQPFFSTKGNSSTGLGLSISKNILESHGGDLYYQNEGVEGHTTFVLKIPRKINLDKTESHIFRSIA
ncbi:MAG: HAMP domain-containing sensor histidine kinase, partial [Bacteriovoracaceae bacterium]|nr:HAMP domain-containing sensor histidine kinase [Bacteriovoracaceae bacterium]